MRSRVVAGFVGATLAAAAALVLWYWSRPVERPPDRLVLAPAGFAALPGWRDDDHAAALAAFRRSCRRLAELADERSLGAGGIAGRIGDWRAPCDAALAVPEDGDDDAARRYFETWFVPFAVANNDRREGLFTGYFEPELRGSRRRAPPFTIPLYRRPDDLVTVDLGRFRDDLRGRRIAGRVAGGRLEPYPPRRAIEAGTLAGRGLELLWVDDPIGAFFLHIQGSGRVRLEDGSIVRVGYAGHNGRPYFAIGRALVERGALKRDEVSMQSIRAWLEAHPDEAAEVMALNPSYVFFRELDGEGPIGALGVALTPGRSLAVDRAFLPLGAPMWLDLTLPAGDGSGGERPFRRLVVAQDSGGAIRGPVRGDVFLGAGPEAAAVAGRMRQTGRYWLLLPKDVAARRLAAN